MTNKQVATSQREEVLLYLKKHGKITTIEAATKLFIADLQSIIRDLRKKMVILDEVIYKKNIYGRPTHYKRYFLEQDQRLSFFERLFW